jgi:hypothetical protein
VNRLTDRQLELLRWIERVGESPRVQLLALRIRSLPTNLIRFESAGLIETCAHPTMIYAGQKALAYRLTEAGRALLKKNEGRKT